MENASKALLMAAGVLIGVLILSLGVYLFATFRDSVSETKKQLENKKISQFNSQFLSYSGRENLTIYDVMELATIAKENNLLYELDDSNDDSDSTMYVQVSARLNGVLINNLEQMSENDKSKYIQDDLNLISYNEGDINDEDDDVFTGLTQYTCSIGISDITGRVNDVVIVPTT